jgi:flagellar biosynthesis anti-sigma factor FlgM
MRIEGSNPWSAMEGLAAQKAEGTQAESDNLNTSASATLDDAHLSREGTLASRLYQRLGDVPDIRREKVEQLRQSFDQGTYSVSTEQIASAMVNDLHGMKLSR